MAKILVSDKLSKDGLDILEASGMPVVMKTGMTEDELCKEIVDYDALIIRSGTKVTKKVIDSARKLKVIGRAGVGVDNVDVPYATEKGILVMNTPTANILSAAEHTCGMILAMARNIPAAHMSMHQGKWDRSRFTGVELNGKVLGIIGVGRVGGEVAKRLKPFNMTMIGYDPFLPKAVADEIGVRLTTLEEVLQKSDFMTIHTPLLPSTKNMISTEQFKMMKPNARLANVARGGIVDEEALYNALKEHTIAGAAFDVWCSEPLDESEKKLLELDNLVTTPHLGASTVEAQERVAVDIAHAAVKYLKDGIITNAINAPRGKLTPETEPYVPLAENMGSLIRQLGGDAPISSVEVSYYGGLAQTDSKLLTVSAVKGIIKGIVGEDGANIINALPVAKSKGIEVKETKIDKFENYANMIEVKTVSGGRTITVRGTAFGSEARLVNYNGYRFNVPLSGDLVFVTYPDVKGVVGRIGAAAADAGIDIREMAVSTKENDSTALTVLVLGSAPGKETVARIAAAAGGDAKCAEL
ncbi:MAG: phosphoglycerate dehydrogenase [Candidatus Methanomethylophilus sp.]|jgi:D-3-phosphoglycerate dehydrogenase|nr:phosphoglycerate dehydrogenase [Methanomethylophilus sp.]MCI2074916.1 phosphoglycerate dehydrogenase [Methanomethylophilus sp.]MCI2093604.1 phosphoglycerate dehydrogenase [Methanomethylophilus sp.]